MIEAVDYDGQEVLESGDKRKCLGLLLLKIDDLIEKFEDEDFSQPAADWVRAGWNIMALASGAGDANLDVSLLSKRQSRYASGPRNRSTLARTAIEYVLREADEFPGTPEIADLTKLDRHDATFKDIVPKRGRQLARFRHYVGEGHRLLGKGIDIEVSAIEDHDGNVVRYEFFDNNTLKRGKLKATSLRKAVIDVSKSIYQIDEADF